MALSKIQSESMNLADTYAFTGTVTGTPSDIVKLASTTVSSSVASVSFDGYFSSTYDHYKICWTRLTPVGGSQLLMRARQSNADLTGSIYRSTILASYFDLNSSTAAYQSGQWNETYGEISYGDGVTNDSAEGGSNGNLYLYGALDSGDKFYISTECHTRNDQNTIERPMINGFINTTGSLSGFSLYFNSNNTASGTITLYGIK
jgi:hypothetical protein